MHSDAEITAPVVENSAEVQPGGVFVARRGLSVDGHQFIAQAVERGAAAIVGEVPDLDPGVPYACVANAQQAVGYLAAAYHGFPSRSLIVIGVTGTDGKTTTSTLIHSILMRHTGRKAGLISTIAADLGARTAETGLHVTTPGAPEIQALLAEMVSNGLTYCVLEMTSHGLAQGRLNGVDLDVAVMTNVTHEHLDYHGTFEEYRAAKASMFRMLMASERKGSQRKASVINGDDPSAGLFASIPAETVIRYGLGADCDLRATHIRQTDSGTAFDLACAEPWPVCGHEVQTRLTGDFNVMNALAAVAAGLAVSASAADIVDGIASVEAISGRMQRINEGQSFIALVDFAHTPNALKNALEAARGLVAPGGRLIAVFGSAGLRDREKRRLMADTAARLADFSILTAEDPRTESLDAILATMADAASAAGGVEGQTFLRVPDRGEAIYRACQLARAGDVVIVCGKGHEQSMAFGTIEYPWDDREALRSALRGQPLSTLPTAKKT